MRSREAIREDVAQWFRDQRRMDDGPLADAFFVPDSEREYRCQTPATWQTGMRTCALCLRELDDGSNLCVRCGPLEPEDVL